MAELETLEPRLSNLSNVQIDALSRSCYDFAMTTISNDSQNFTKQRLQAMVILMNWQRQNGRFTDYLPKLVSAEFSGLNQNASEDQRKDLRKIYMAAQRCYWYCP